MPVVKITEHFLANGLTVPEARARIEYIDEQVRNFFIEVRATSQGEGTYYVRYRDKAKTTRYVKIARTTDNISLSDARAKARTVLASIALGSDPRAEAKAQSEVLTFERFFEDHYLPYVKPRKRSWKRDDELYRLRIKNVFGNKRLNQISRQPVALFHTGLLTEGLSPASCDHHVKLLRHALNLAVEWEMLDKNPITKIPLFNHDNKVEHYVDGAELEKLLTVLRTDPARAVCQIAMFLLSTGCRLNEALSAKWCDVDRHNRVWRIPATNSKSKRVRSVPLNDAALDVISKLSSEGKFEHLFINTSTGKPYTTIMKVWTRLRTKAGLPHLRIHDLRHQYASFLVNSGRTLYEVQQILGHSDSKVTARYSHLSSKSLQEAANSASVAIQGAMKVPA